jgi:CoA:oxalate CoA-transferase
MQSLLQNITVLDFSHYIAGPYCGFLLADMGARVIKVEPPEGAEERRIGAAPRYRMNTRTSLAFNRGKESLVVDLKEEEGKKIIHQLVQKADVVIQNFVPGAAQKLGIDYETLSAINPGLVFVSSTAFGEQGPYRNRKGFDIIAHAASGIMSNYADEDGEPRGPGGLHYIDMSTGMLNALSVVSALYYRDKSGVGQKIESSLFSTGLALQAVNMVHVDNLDDQLHRDEKELLSTAHDNGLSHTQIIDEFAKMRLRDDLPDTTRPIEVPDCNHRPADRHVYPYYRVYETADGYLSVGALSRKQREALCTLLDVEDNYLDINVGNVSDKAYFSQKQTMKMIEIKLKSQGNNDWIEQLEAVGVPCGQVNYRADLYQDPQVKALDLMWKLNNRDLGDYLVPGNPLRFSETPLKSTVGAPVLGEHSAKVLAEFGYSGQAITDLIRNKVIKDYSVPTETSD